MTTLSSILAWRIPWTKKPDGLQSTDLKSWLRLSTHIHECVRGDVAAVIAQSSQSFVRFSSILFPHQPHWACFFPLSSN